MPVPVAGDGATGENQNENDKHHPCHLRLAIRELDPDQGDEKTKARGRQIGKPLSQDRSRRREQVRRGGKSADVDRSGENPLPFSGPEGPKQKTQPQKSCNGCGSAVAPTRINTKGVEDPQTCGQMSEGIIQKADGFFSELPPLYRPK